MSEVLDRKNGRGVRLFAVVLAVLSVLSLAVTVWIVVDVQHEMEIVQRIMQHLPASDLTRAQDLSGTLQLQHRLSVLLALNTFGTAIALVVVVRAYFSSEQSLRDAKVLASDIRASMDVAIITTDQQGKITSMNPKVGEILDLADDWVGRPLAEVDAQHQLLEAIRAEVSREHSRVRDRDYQIRDHGHTRTLRACCSLLRNQRGEEIGTVVHVSDVTEKALMEDRLRRMERYIGLGSLAAGLKHEIRNPLSALSLHIQLLREQLLDAALPKAGRLAANRLQTQAGPAPLALVPPGVRAAENDEVQCILDVLRDEVHRINAVLDSFGNYAALEQLGRTPVDIQSLVEKMARLLRPQATEQAVTIHLATPDEALPLVQADPVRLEQVLLNLALNGLAAMPDGGRLTFRLERCDDMLEIVVADTGPGIPKDIQGQIFEPYFTTRHDGTGMGLALSDKIVRQHGGNIDFKTGPGGTEFSVFLPLEATDEA